MKRILITGGAGFIGSHLAADLLRNGYYVRVLDNLSSQVHGPDSGIPEYLDPEVDFHFGDIRDPAAVRRALDGVDAVFHFVSIVGVGQSMYDLVRYVDVNNLGTAVLLESLIEQPVERLIVASSMSIYGEGLYRDSAGAVHPSVDRTLDQLKASRWEMRSPEGETLIPAPTPEWKTPSLASIYALNKYDQERMCLIVGQAYGIATTALRFFNAYGPHQALSNPYTGVLAIFASRLLNGNSPVVFEDGNQLRDFVSVYDVASACRLTLETPAASGQAFNIGSGHRHTVTDVARRMAHIIGKPYIEPHISGRYRVGDIRHCFPDIALARKVLGFEPAVSLEEGLLDLAAWLESQVAADRFSQARAELTSRGLVV